MNQGGSLYLSESSVRCCIKIYYYYIVEYSTDKLKLKSFQNELRMSGTLNEIMYYLVVILSTIGINR